MMLSCPASLIFFLSWEPSETEILTLKQRWSFMRTSFFRDPHVFDVELLRRKRKWCSTEDADLPTNAVQTLAACICDREFFPNIHTLIRILCTLPITSAEFERSFRTRRRLKTYLRSTMSGERESGLALMNINYHRDTNIEEMIYTFAQRQPRRLLSA